MSNPSNVKTLSAAVRVHAKNLDTLVIDTKRVSFNYNVPDGSPSGTIAIASAPVSLTNNASVVNGAVVTPQGQQPGSNAISASYSTPVSAGDPTTVYAAIFAKVAEVTGYTYEA